MATLSAAFVAASLSGAAEAETYPDKTIQIVCPSAAGGGSDTLVRLFGGELEKLAGQPVLVLNKPGAGALIGTKSVVTARPDGYTLLVHASSAIVGNSFVLREAGYSPTRDLAPVAALAQSSSVVVVGPNSPVHSIAELTALIKSKSGKATYSTPNNFITAAAELYLAAVGAEATRVNYKDVTTAIGDVTAGEVDFSLADITLALAQAKAGRVRVLAVTTRERSDVAPDLPTMIEAGVPDYDYVTFFGAWAPAGTPKPIVDMLSHWFVELAQRKDIRAGLMRSGFQPLAGGEDALRQMVAQDAERWRALIASGKIERQ
jgi:tripartite-type tricarboxylate transporter receptor subunit TctC